MRQGPDPGGNRGAGVLRRSQKGMEGSQNTLAASAANGRASSPSGSVGSTPRVSGSTDPRERDYVRAILDCYLWLPGTADVTSRHDRRCAEQLYRRGVPLEVVKSAMVVAVARRSFRRGDPLPRVRAVHFFLPVVEEMLETPCEPGYVEYLELRLRPLAAAKAAQTEARQTSPSREPMGKSVAGNPR